MERILGDSQSWLRRATAASVLMVGLHPHPGHAFDAQSLGVVLAGGDCPRCDLSGADLVARDLSHRNFSGANLARAKLSLASLKATDLRDADLRGAELASTFIFGANLSGANLSDAKLQGAYLHQANLERARLCGANLSNAHLFDANLQDADLRGTRLEGANLAGANLERSSLQQAILEDTIYDSTTRFPAGFSAKDHRLTTVTPPSESDKEPDRSNARRAEIHHLSLARMILVMGAADASSYGGCQDRTCFDLPTAVNERLAKLQSEEHGEGSLENATELLSTASLYREQRKSQQAEELYLRAFALLKKNPNKDDSLLAESQMELASIYRSQRRLREAESILRASIALIDKPASSLDSMDPVAIVILRSALGDLTEIHILEGNYAEAEGELRRTDRLTKEKADDPLQLQRLRLAWIRHGQGRRNEAENLYQEILKQYKTGFPEASSPQRQLIEQNIQRLHQALPPILELTP